MLICVEATFREGNCVDVGIGCSMSESNDCQGVAGDRLAHSQGKHAQVSRHR